MTAQTRVARGRTQGRAPGVRHRTSMPITQDEAAMLERFWGGEDLGPGFETLEGGAAPALSAEPDIIYGGAQGPALSLPGIGPITPEEAEAVARFMDDGEGGFDGPATPAMTVVSKGGVPHAATAQEAAQGRPPMVTQTVGSGRLPNPAAPVAGSEEADEELGWDDYAKDIFYSAGTGLAEGAIGLAGLAGDVQDLARSAARKAGVDPSVLDYVPGGDLLRRDWWGSEELRDAVEDKFGPLYQPKTAVGRVMHTAGTLAPGAFVPGGLVARAANVAVPTLLSEGAGRLFEGTQYENVARAGGAAAGALTPMLMTRSLLSLPVSSRRQAAAKLFDEQGIPITAGQEFGSKRIQQLENLSEAAAQKVAEQQKKGFTRAALKKGGAEADKVRPDILDAAAKSIDERVSIARQALDPAAYHDALKEARRQRKNIDTVRRAMKGGGEDAGLGYVSPRRLAEADSGPYGTGDFDDLARAGEAIMTPPPQMQIGTGLGGLSGRIADAAVRELGGRAMVSRPVQSFLRNDLIRQSRWPSTIPRAGYNWTTAWQSRPDPSENS